MLLILQPPSCVGVFASIMRLPQYLLLGVITVLCLVGTYSVNNSFIDIYILIGMGVVGYVLRKFKFDMAPLVLALGLGRLRRRSFRQTLVMARGEMGLIFGRPITAVLLGLGLAAIILSIFWRWKAAHKQRTKGLGEPYSIEAVP